MYPICLNKMEWRNKLLIIGALLFIVINIVLYVYEDNVCDPEWENIGKNLDYIKAPNSVKRIELFKAYPNSDYKSNLIGDTIVLTDTSVIESIRTMVNERNSGTWNRPTAAWNVKLRMITDNDKTFDFMVSKISNDSTSAMTHIYFGSTHCKDNLPSYSLTLGNYLETLTEYKGENY